MGTRIAEVVGMVWVQCSHAQPCKGGEKLEILNAMIKHQAMQEAKTEQAYLGSWIPTANHKITFID